MAKYLKLLRTPNGKAPKYWQRTPNGKVPKIVKDP